MKKIKRWIAVCCLLFAATLIPVDAQEAFIIDDLHVSMEVHEDGGIDITETYVLNFSMDFFVISQPPMIWSGLWMESWKRRAIIFRSVK